MRGTLEVRLKRQITKTMTEINIYKDDFCISTDKTKLDLDAIHDFLSTQAYWCLNIPKEKVQIAIDNSLCFGVYKEKKQIGFARIISDFSTIAYLGDVYILKEYRGKGLSKWLMETVMDYSQLQGLRRWILLTGDAHGLYRQFGWTNIADSTKWMEIHNKNVYSK
ncbi:MAG: GNAT family N-acetyltransferase [Flavobacteriales bacterium]